MEKMKVIWTQMRTKEKLVGATLEMQAMQALLQATNLLEHNQQPKIAASSSLQLMPGLQVKRSRKVWEMMMTWSQVITVVVGIRATLRTSLAPLAKSTMMTK